MPGPGARAARCRSPRRSTRRTPRCRGRSSPRACALRRSRLVLLPERARYHEADARAVVVDGAGLVVDQAALLGARDQQHLVDVAVAAALAGEDPEVAVVADPRAVFREGRAALLERLDHHHGAVELTGAHQAAPDRVLEVAAEAGAHVAGHLDPLIGLHAELLDGTSVAVIGVSGHGAGQQVCRERQGRIAI